jgi:endosialidase-like protein
MLKRKTICSSFLLLILSFNTARAQNEVPKGNRSSAATITASASGERVRFTAPSSVVQIRLEIYNPTGTKLVDNEVRGGNVLDWHLQGGQAEPLPDDSYLCVVTVKSLSGKLTQRIGSVTVEKSSASLQPVDASQVTAQQSQAIGPVEENASWIVLNEDEKQTTTVIAHNGTEGQITRGRGALTFRIGDFFSGKDTEQMRLTAEGNLGIGTSDPQVKLDVAGMIGAREGVMFSDGSTLRVNKKGVLTHSKGGGDVSISAAGTGTLNRLAKWTETGGAGLLGDSVVTESPSGFLGIGTTAPVSALELAGLGANGSGGITLGTGAVAKSVYQVLRVGSEIISFFGGNLFVDPSLMSQRFNTSHVGWAVALDGRASQDLFKLERLSAAGLTTRPAIIRGDGSFGFGNMTSPPNLTGAKFMMDSAGNVGIGTTIPSQLLHLSRGGAGSSTDVQLDNTDTGGVSWSISSVGNIGGRVGNFEIKRPGVSIPFQITPNGLVGIGTTNPTDKLHIQTTSLGEGITITDGTSTLRAQIQTDGVRLGTTSSHNLIFTQGNFDAVVIEMGIGNMFPNYDGAQLLGKTTKRWSAVFAVNGVIQTSDARLKKTVTNLGYGLSQVMQLRPVSFQWKDRTDGRTHLGLIAQEVENIIPEAVERDKDPATPLGMNYTSLVPVVIKAIQEQQITLSTLKAENAALKARLAGLEKTRDANLALARQRHSRLRGVKHVVSTGNATHSRSKAGRGLVALN